MTTLSSRRVVGSVGITAAASLGSTSVWACYVPYSIAYAPFVASASPVSVPSLSTLGVAALAAGVGVVAWRQRKTPGARLMAVALLAAASLMANEGGGGLVQKAYAAVIAVNLGNAAGGAESGMIPAIGDTITFTNTSGVPLQFNGITYTNPVPGRGTMQGGGSTCSPGSVIPVGGSCTTSPVTFAEGLFAWNGVTCVGPLPGP